MDEEKAKWKKKIKKVRSRRKRMGGAGGMAMGRGGPGPKDGVFAPAPHGFVLSHPCLAPPRMTEKIFLPNSRPLDPCEAPPHPVKLYFLLICLLLLQFFFFMKLISLVKIYLKLQINLSHQIKLIFSKN